MSLSKEIPAMFKRLLSSSSSLSESEKSFRFLVNSITDGIILVDDSHRIVFWNDGARDIYGYCAEEMLGKEASLVLPERYREGDCQGFDKLRAQGTVERKQITYETTGLTKSGTEIPLEVSFSLYEIEGKRFYCSIMRNITGRKKIEKALQESEEQLRSFMEQANDAIFICDGRGTIKLWNRKAEELYGYTADEVLGKPYSIVVPQRFKEAHQKWLEKYLAGDELAISGKIVEGIGERKDGSQFYAETSTAILKQRDEKLLVAIIRDITERKRSQEIIEQEKDFTSTIIETADVLIIAVDNNGNIMRFNRKAEEVTGYGRDEVIGEGLINTLSLHMDTDAIRRMMQEISEGNPVSPYNLFIKTKAGEERIIYSRGRQLKDKHGAVIGVLEIGIDVTEQRKMEDKLLQAEKLRDLGELAGGVAHDFNNVLAAILGRAQLLKHQLEEGTGNERRKSYFELKEGLDVIERAANDGAETVRRIQEFARIRPDDRDILSVDINEVINNALDFTRARWKDEAEFKGINVAIDKNLATVPPVLGSPAELREVITNLINNALDAMPRGGAITVKTYTESNHVCIRFEDTGAGIPPHIQERIFDPFFTTKGPQSTGLGMSVSYGIITRHQGTISVESQEGSGTAFTIKFPIKAAEGAVKVEGQQIQEPVGKAKILVIEDEEDVRTLLQDILEMHGHEVAVAAHGEEGIAAFKKGTFDLVFTDLGMPGMSGWEVAQAIKEIDPEVAIAIITGWGIKMDEEELKKSGVDLILNKPFTMDNILKLTGDALVVKKGSSPHQEGNSG